MKFHYMFFFYGMITVLILIGLFQFFNLPSYINVILWIIALLFGTLGWTKKWMVNSSIIGALSIVMAVLTMVLFFAIPDLALTVKLLTVLSILGIVFAVLSKRMWFMIGGIILNGAMLVVAFFLLLAMGISEP